MTWTFPIIVDRFKGNAALRAGCNHCGKTTLYKDVDDFISACEIGHCPRCKGPSSEYVAAFEEGDRCFNCQKLDYEMPIKGLGNRRYCTQICRLQGDYAFRLDSARDLPAAEKAVFANVAACDGYSARGLARRDRDALQRLRRKGLVVLIEREWYRI